MKIQTFNVIWKDGIVKKGKRIVDDNIGKVEFDEKSKVRILKEYNKLRDYTKISYMRNPDGLLDRHKVCACLIIAIVKSSPLINVDINITPEMKPIYNENLAMSVGLSLLKYYIITAHSQEKKYKEIFKDGFRFPQTDLDTRYQELLCLMLHYDIEIGNYSILAIANILFLIEEYTKVTYKDE